MSSTDQDIDAPTGFIADPDKLAAHEMPDLQKLQADVERWSSTIAARRVEGGDTTDAKRKLRQAEDALREGQELAQQIEAARAYVHQRDRDARVRDQSKAQAEEARRQAEALRDAASHLETADKAVRDALGVLDGAVAYNPLLPATGRRTLRELIATLSFDMHRPDEMPCGDAKRLRRLADSVDAQVGTETDG